MLLLLGRAATAAPPVLAVLPLQDAGAVLTEPEREALGSLFAASLAEAGGYALAPRPELEARLREWQVRSHEERFDSALAVRLGRELAASLLVEPRLLRVGERCALAVTTYTLEDGVSERSLTEEARCAPEPLFVATRTVAGRLGGKAPPPPPAPPAPDTPRPRDWLRLGLGYASTLGGIAGPMASLQVGELRWGPLSWTVAELGGSLAASRTAMRPSLFGPEAYPQDYQIRYLGSVLGLSLEPDEDQRVVLAVGPAALLVEQDLTFDELPAADRDATEGLRPAAALRLGYQLALPELPLRSALGAALFVLHPFGDGMRGAPTVAGFELSFALGAAR